MRQITSRSVGSVSCVSRCLAASGLQIGLQNGLLVCSSRSLRHDLDRSSYLARHPLGAFTVPELTGRARAARDLNHGEDTIRSEIIDAVASGRAQDLTLEPAVGRELAATGALPPVRFHCSARVTFGPLLV